ncbi:hypothetical protein KJ713_01460 [Patescibacteria group bacterium]|nr:hypothetical protein [Patescibacteria group bacterium]
MNIYYLEWWEEQSSPSPSPTPSPDINVLPESGKNIVGFVNRALGI